MNTNKYKELVVQTYHELKECLSYNNRKKYIGLTNNELVGIFIVWVVFGILIFSN